MRLSFRDRWVPCFGRAEQLQSVRSLRNDRGATRCRPLVTAGHFAGLKRATANRVPSASGTDEHLDPSVLLPARLGGLGALRPRLAEGAHADPGCGNALGHHGRSHRFRTTRAELLVIWRGAARVRVAVEPDLVARVVLHVLHQLVDLGHLRRPPVALVEVEQGVAERGPRLRRTGGPGRAGDTGRSAGSRRTCGSGRAWRAWRARRPGRSGGPGRCGNVWVFSW